MNRKPLLALFLALALVGCDLEAMSKLSKECRLPAFFTIPAGFARSDLTVEQKVYTDGHRDFSLQDLNGRELAHVTAKKGRSYPRQNGSGWIYPSYDEITVGKITEIIEHRTLEPIFYVTDDPNVLTHFPSDQAR